MKRYHIFVFFLCSLLTMMFLSSCKKAKSESNGFDEEAQRSYEAVIALQNKSMQVFDGFLATQDTAAAKVSLAAWFKTDATVEWAKVSSQGVMVKYTNGICGGLILDFDRKKGGLKSLKLAGPENALNTDPFNNLPSKKKAIILAAFYDQFANEVDIERANWGPDFALDGITNEAYLTTLVTLDKLSELTGWGVIDFNTHGIAWPDQVNTEEVFMFTREHISNGTTKKYWDDVKQGFIGAFSLKKDNSTIYAIKPAFITKHNDFSKDTVLFYGGFCYSALGSWLSIVNSCAAGTYFGFNWRVYSDKCIDWAIDLIHNLSDHSLATPMTVEQWMSTTPIPKQYWDAENQKTVKIIYNGYGGLTFWKADLEQSGEIVSTEADGAPIKTKGYTCGTYTLKCSLKGKFPEHLAYEWDYGDLFTYYTVDDSLALYHQWTEAKSYTVKVKITERYTGKLVKELKTTVSFIEPNYLQELKKKSITLSISFGPQNALLLSNGEFAQNQWLGCNTSHYEEPLTWIDSSFTASDRSNNMDYYLYSSIKVKGNVSSDGKILRHCLITHEDDSLNPHRRKMVLEITNLPILHIGVYPDIPCEIQFLKDTEGSIVHTYVTKVDYQEYDYNILKQTWITLSSIDWPNTYLHVRFWY